MERIRKKIDTIDEKLIGLLAQRFDEVMKISRLKKQENTGIVDRLREQEVIRKARKNASDKGLDPDFAQEMIQRIIAHSRKLQGGEDED